MHTSSMHPSITPLYIHLAVPHFPHLFQLKLSHQALLEWSIRQEVHLASWIIQTGLFTHSFQKLFFTCTLNTGVRLFMMSQRLLAKYKCTELKVSAVKNHLRGILTFPSRLKERTVGMKLIWLHGCKVSMAFCYTVLLKCQSLVSYPYWLLIISLLKNPSVVNIHPRSLLLTVQRGVLNVYEIWWLF